MSMFCYQCEQTAKGTGCTSVGVCGKDSETATLQDLLLYVTEGISQYAHRARTLAVSDPSIDRFVVEALFTTVTNVNFDADRIAQMIRTGVDMRTRARELYETATKGAGMEIETLTGPAGFEPAENRGELMTQGAELGIKARQARAGETVIGLQELIMYGLKGTAAYADHALVLGLEDEKVYADFHRFLDYLAGDPADANDLTAKALEVGELNVRVMELLDRANTETYGHPEPTRVRTTPVAGKCILVSGHDLKDLAELLEQTKGKGINVYTHGEMLPCLAYPELKKYPHLVGNYGGAWQDQRKEFDAFPGAILMTTNCIQRPKDAYQARIFTTGLVGWPGVTHVTGGDFSAVIDAALEAPGFEADEPEHMITIGFGHQAVLGVADTVIDAVKGGAIRHFFLVGGCDGAKPGRNYYTDFTQQVPEDCVIMTLACGKFRFNKLDFGEIGGLPRLLDIGQCNDAYSAVRITLALADAFDCDVNDLPLSIILSWYEQKAVCVLLSLLHLGIKNIRIGPSLPAFVSQPVLQVLVETFGLTPIGTPEEDLKAILDMKPVEV